MNFSVEHEVLPPLSAASLPEVEPLPNREASPKKYSDCGRILVLLTLGSCKHLPLIARCDPCHPRM